MDVQRETVPLQTFASSSNFLSYSQILEGKRFHFSLQPQSRMWKSVFFSGAAS